jgi:hypothetical protein
MKLTINHRFTFKDEFKRQAITMVKPEPSQSDINQLNKNYQILDELIAAAEVNFKTLRIARNKVNAESNGNQKFRTMVVRLAKKQLIKLRLDLELVHFF